MDRCRRPYRRRWCVLGATLVDAVVLVAFSGSAALAATRQAALRQKLTADSASANACYGGGVAISGDTALVSCAGQTVADGSGTDHPGAGAVYVYTRSAGVWSEQAVLTDPVAADGDQFGESVALSGDTAVVGAISAGGTGAAYVYSRTGADWSQPTTWPRPTVPPVTSSAARSPCRAARSSSAPTTRVSASAATPTSMPGRPTCFAARVRAGRKKPS